MTDVTAPVDLAPIVRNQEMSINILRERIFELEVELLNTRIACAMKHPAPTNGDQP